MSETLTPQTNESREETSGHTPGPWVVSDIGLLDENGEGSLDIYDPELRNWIAAVHGTHVGPNNIQEAKANARLIAAAPELLTALKFARDTIKIWHGEVAWPEYQHSPKMKMINGAIAKAEGKA